MIIFSLKITKKKLYACIYCVSKKLYLQRNIIKSSLIWQKFIWFNINYTNFCAMDYVKTFLFNLIILILYFHVLYEWFNRVTCYSMHFFLFSCKKWKKLKSKNIISYPCLKYKNETNILKYTLCELKTEPLN